MGIGNIHIGKDIWTWRGHKHEIEIRDPKGQKTRLTYARLQGLEYGDDVRSVTPRDIKQFIEEVLLLPPDGVKCLTCYGKGTRVTGGRSIKCAICDGLGRREPSKVPKW